MGSQYGRGVRVDYPVMSDVEFYARGESLANDRALFLVGEREVESRRARARAATSRSASTATTSSWVKSTWRRRTAQASGSQLGAAFIRPNPRRPDRYVVVVEGVGPARHVAVALAARHAARLRRVRRGPGAGERAARCSAPGKLRAAGFFDNGWSPPRDEPAAVARARARGDEHKLTRTATPRIWTGNAMRAKPVPCRLCRRRRRLSRRERARPMSDSTIRVARRSSGVHLRGRAAPAASGTRGPFDDGGSPGVGFRGTVNIADGFIKSINDSVGVGFGIDIGTDGRVLVPHRHAVELLALDRTGRSSASPDSPSGRAPHNVLWPAFYAGGSFHFTDRIALTMRLGYPDVSVGVSFLL